MNKQIIKKQVVELQNNISDTKKLSEIFFEYASTIKISDEIYNDIRLVIEEVFVNIASYAYKNDEPGSIMIKFSHTYKDIHITFTDTGTAFNPLTDANLCKKTDSHCNGGMGIHLITSLSDQQKYNRINQSNVFTVTKHYTK